MAETNETMRRHAFDCGIAPDAELAFIHDADRLAEAESILRALQPHIRAMELDLGYDQIFSDRINAFLLDGE